MLKNKLYTGTSISTLYIYLTGVQYTTAGTVGILYHI